jgi:very-short-patch-repair endonuclease
MTVIFNIQKLKERRAELRWNQTPQEEKLWFGLRRNKLGFKWRRQHSIGGYIADFYCPKKKLVIELDGSQHSEKGSKEYDKNRTNFLEGAGIKVLRFKNNEIENNLIKVLGKIKKELCI